MLTFAGWSATSARLACCRSARSLAPYPRGGGAWRSIPPSARRILGKVDDYGEIARIVRHHHERMDGNGYPDRLCGDEIPIISRIIAVADAYNAMTSGRPYRDAMPSRVARFRLAQATGTQFDTTVVAAFEASSPVQAKRTSPARGLISPLKHSSNHWLLPASPRSSQVPRVHARVTQLGVEYGRRLVKMLPCAL